MTLFETSGYTNQLKPHYLLLILMINDLLVVRFRPCDPQQLILFILSEQKKLKKKKTLVLSYLLNF